ncbi:MULTISPECIES: DUF4097 family beta strand repeat-containing protein [unclassified Pseudoalteromonas]|uniref:DUF4097 family beta strand repeat-containing protein n=1 Tax=unclassified Pseudoalteromonas TaxID=194690 RepID=UPI000CF72517|nr:MULTISPECIES: DUF4097 family beta strand repeat-containing protein [unclassified Pseudoalteromonas]MBS3797350.1 DUF4097 family beta strand repeat protein [Pseudoalteromonas sp. BDTF-M6]
MKALAYTLAMVPCLALAGEKIDEQISVPADGRIFIDNQRGDIIIKGWDKASLQIKGELDDRAEGYTLETRGQRTDFIVKMPKNYNKGWGWGNNNDDNGEGSKLTIYMPMQSALSLEGINVDVDVSELSSDSRIETVNGDIDAKDLSGKLIFETVNGDVSGTNLNGDIRYQTVNGDINDVDSQGQLRMTLVNGDVTSTTKSEDIRFENVNGDLTLRAHTLGSLKLNTVNGELEVYVKELKTNAQIRAESVSGDFDLYLPTNVSARFDLDAHAGGDIRNELSKDKAVEAKYGPGESLSFTLGQGEAEVEVTTISGNTNLRKND